VHLFQSSIPSMLSCNFLLMQEDTARRSSEYSLFFFFISLLSRYRIVIILHILFVSIIIGARVSSTGIVINVESAAVSSAAGSANTNGICIRWITISIGLWILRIPRISRVGIPNGIGLSRLRSHLLPFKPMIDHSVEQVDTSLRFSREWKREW